MVLPTIVRPRLHRKEHPAWNDGILTYRILQSSRNVGDRSPPVDCVTPSVTFEASQWMGVPVQSQLNFSTSYSQNITCSVLSNRVLLSSSGTQPTAVAIDLMVCGASWASLANNPQGGSTPQPLRLSFWSAPFRLHRVPFELKLCSYYFNNLYFVSINPAPVGL